jgi:hypothetical protein
VPISTSAGPRDSFGRGSGPVPNRGNTGRPHPDKRLIGLWPCFFLRLMEFSGYRQRSWPEGRVKMVCPVRAHLHELCEFYWFYYFVQSISYVPSTGADSPNPSPSARFQCVVVQNSCGAGRRVAQPLLAVWFCGPTCHRRRPRCSRSQLQKSHSQEWLCY